MHQVLQSSLGNLIKTSSISTFLERKNRDWLRIPDSGFQSYLWEAGFHTVGQIHNIIINLLNSSGLTQSQESDDRGGPWTLIWGRCHEGWYGGRQKQWTGVLGRWRVASQEQKSREQAGWQPRTLSVERSSEEGRLGMLWSASSKLRVGEWGGDEVSGVEKLKKLRSESPGRHG